MNVVQSVKPPGIRLSLANLEHEVLYPRGYSLSIGTQGLAWSTAGRIEPGPSEAARCASRPLFFFLSQPLLKLQYQAVGRELTPPSPEGAGHNLPQLAAVALRVQRRSAYCLSRFGRVYGIRASQASWVPSKVWAASAPVRLPTSQKLFSAAALSRLWPPSDRGCRCRRKTAHR